MARLPVEGSDNNQWGALLNEYLEVSHTSGGEFKANTVGSSQIQDGSVTSDKVDSTVAAAEDFVAKDELIYNVIDYGATGDGSTDDTAAIQSAIDASIGENVAGGAASTRIPSGPVYLPAGTYNISSPLQIYSTNGFHLFGAGIEQTKLQATTDINSILDINGSYRGNFHDFSLRASNTSSITVDQPLWCYWDGGTDSVRPTSGVVFRSIRVGGVRWTNAGIRLGANNNFQCDDITVMNCLVNGQFEIGETTFWQAGIKSDAASGNTLNHWIYGSGVNFCRRGLHAQTCQQWTYGMDIGHNEVDFYVQGDAPFSVNGWRSESSGMMLEVAGGTSVTGNITLRDGEQGFKDSPSSVVHPFTADARMIVMGRSGNLLLEGVMIKTSGIADDPVIYSNNGSADKFTQITLLNCNIGMTQPEDLIEIGHANAATSLTLINHTIGADNTLATGYVPFYQRNYSGAAVQPQFYGGIADFERLGIAKAAGGEFIRPRVQRNRSSVGWNSGLLGLSYFRATVTETINSLTAWTSATDATGATLIKYGVYEVDESSGDLTLVASTDNDTTLLQSNDTAYNKALASSWSKVSGKLYALGVLVVDATPTLITTTGGDSSASASAAVPFGVEPKLSVSIGGQSDLPASITDPSTGSLRAPYFEMHT